MTRILILSCIAAGLLAGAALAEKGKHDPHASAKAKEALHAKASREGHSPHKGKHGENSGLHKGHEKHPFKDSSKDYHEKKKLHPDYHAEKLRGKKKLHADFDADRYREKKKLHPDFDADKYREKKKHLDFDADKHREKKKLHPDHHADKHHEKAKKHLEHADKHAAKGHEKQADKHTEKAFDLHKKGPKSGK